MRKVFSYALPYKWIAAWAFLFMLLELAIDLLQPLIMARIIDEGILQNDLQAVQQWGIVLLALSLVGLFFGIANSYFSSHAAQSFSFELRNALFEKMQRFTMSTYAKFPASSLITRLTSDVTQVQNLLFMSLRIMLRAPLYVAGSLVMMFFINAKLAFYFVIVTPFAVIFLYIVVKKGARNFAQVQRRVDRLNRVLQESLQAIRLVKAYLRGQYEASRFEKIADSLKLDTMKALRLMEVLLPVLWVFMNGALLVVIWLGSAQIEAGNTQVGELVAIINYATRMTAMFSMFAFIISAFARAQASSHRMKEVLVIEDGLEDLQPATAHDLQPIALRFDDVSFSYAKDVEPVLQNISFSVAAGEKVAIIGATGSGKTTLLSLVPNFHEATGGTVYVNDLPIQSWSREELRAHMGLVLQQSILFTGTIAENIRWGKKDATDAEVMNAAVRAQIHESIMQFDDGYDTRVGQKGVNLSGGQKQRIAIARALIRQPKLLILDDSTSALDVTTEAALWAALAEEQMTMLVVTQKIVTAERMDKIMLLEEGRVVQIGTHAQLLEQSTLYQQIYASQQGGIAQ
ncbi:ABC transporter ATP-binding protein [Caryophanon latum]|uniref:ABC transporter ATP-binding protein n=1 Tax=Caryophanon latum TaxID=33977 RepID=A0A1C0Z464_9BACL|nr:ABC transporter ATP-binding protein [Caryophanon latum]OCS94274.1 ABC transporter ATP-binding protein [Caryophanon latum]